ncbi:hypothetical protein [Cellulomonas hominis]
MVEITAAVVGAVVALLGSVLLSIHARRRDRLDERVAGASGALTEMWLRSQRATPKLLRGYWPEDIVVLFGRTLRSLHELRVVLGRRKRGRRAGFAKTLEHAFDAMRDVSLTSATSPHSTDARNEFIRSVQIAQAACDRWIADPRSYRKGDLYDELAKFMTPGN